MICWNCQASLKITDKKISFRAICDTCLAALHCCKNCKFYSPGRPNDCAVPGTEPISDRSANNFCDEFSLLEKIIPSPSSSNQGKKKFEDLFRN